MIFEPGCANMLCKNWYPPDMVRVDRSREEAKAHLDIHREDNSCNLG